MQHRPQLEQRLLQMSEWWQKAFNGASLVAARALKSVFVIQACPSTMVGTIHASNRAMKTQNALSRPITNRQTSSEPCYAAVTLGSMTKLPHRAILLPHQKTAAAPMPQLGVTVQKEIQATHIIPRACHVLQRTAKHKKRLTIGIFRNHPLCVVHDPSSCVLHILHSFCFKMLAKQ